MLGAGVAAVSAQGWRSPSLCSLPAWQPGLQPSGPLLPRLVEWKSSFLPLAWATAVEGVWCSG